MLGQRQQRPFRVLRIRTHGCEAVARQNLGLPIDSVDDVAVAGRLGSEDRTRMSRKEAFVVSEEGTCLQLQVFDVTAPWPGNRRQELP